jgi:hypothetical protein
MVGGESDSLTTVVPWAKGPLSGCLPVPVASITQLLAGEGEDLLIVWWSASRLLEVKIEPISKAWHHGQDSFAFGLLEFLFFDPDISPDQSRHLASRQPVKNATAIDGRRLRSNGKTILKHCHSKDLTFLNMS